MHCQITGMKKIYYYFQPKIHKMTDIINPSNIYIVHWNLTQTRQQVNLITTIHFSQFTYQFTTPLEPLNIFSAWLGSCVSDFVHDTQYFIHSFDVGDYTNPPEYKVGFAQRCLSFRPTFVFQRTMLPPKIYLKSFCISTGNGTFTTFAYLRSHSLESSSTYSSYLL